MRASPFVQGCFLALASILLAARPAAATVEIRQVDSGTAVIYLNANLLRALSVPIVSVQSTAEIPEPLSRMEDPHWAFAVRGESDFLFRVEHDRAEPHEVLGGRVSLDGSIVFRNDKTGVTETLQSMEIAPWPGDANDHAEPAELVLRNGATGAVFFRLVHSMFDYAPADQALNVHYMNVEIAPEWAARLGDPSLAGWSTGIVELAAGTRLEQALPDTLPEPVAVFGDTVQVTLGKLESLSYIGRQGTYPNGTNALSMATTACNMGDYDVPWLAPMQEDHPVIAMALYRLLDGRFEQIGISYLKHGFYALSNNDCSSCRHPSNGTFLGNGCSDTYGVNNNSDRNYLGPRDEVNPFTAEWHCLGSHFSGGQPDCVRRHGASGHAVLDHRLIARDADLNQAGAQYFYEAYYLVRRDYDRWNNIGSRRFTANWNGSVWQFSTPNVDNALLPGPALDRYGDLRTIAQVGPDDGRFKLAVTTTPLGGGMYHYEYALFNLDSDLQAGTFRVPVPDSVQVTNFGFHDWDNDPTNDWQVTLENGALSWQAGAYPDTLANALSFGLLMNFRFDAAAPPADVQATIETWKPHAPSGFDLATRGPAAASGVSAVTARAGLRLEAARPNPTSNGATLGFYLPTASETSLEVFAPSGRHVRTLLRGREEAGEHQSAWDGADEESRSVPAGVYYLKLVAGGETRVRSVTILR